MIAHAPGVHSLGRNLPLQPWNSMWLSMIALEPSVCAIFLLILFSIKLSCSYLIC